MIRSRALSCLVSVAALALAGCAEDTGFEPRPLSISGRVRLVAHLTAADGRSLGTRFVDDADGVPIELVFGDRVVARAATVDGAFRFTGLGSGGYLARARVSDLLVAESGTVTLAMQDVALPEPLRLVSVGDLYPVPNPFTSRVAIAYSLGETQRVRMRALDAGGRLVRVILDAVIPAGDHTVFWSGLDSVGVSAPGELFWITFEAGIDGRAQLVLR